MRDLPALVVLAIPAAALTGLAFAAPIVAFSATQRTPDRFNTLFRFGITPLFLFSGTFYPVSSYGDWAWVAQLSPLYHGVVVARGLNLGVWSWTYIPHLAVLVAMALVGVAVTARRIDTLLLK